MKTKFLLISSSALLILGCGGGNNTDTSFLENSSFGRAGILFVNNDLDAGIYNLSNQNYIDRSKENDSSHSIDWNVEKTGKKILKITNINDGQKIETFNISDRTNPLSQFITKNEFVSFKLSPDGNYILGFMKDANNDNYLLKVLSKDGENILKIDFPFSQGMLIREAFDWTSDSKYFLFIENKSITKINIFTREIFKLKKTLSKLPLTFSNGGYDAIYSLAVSHDDKKIAFSWGANYPSSFSKNDSVSESYAVWVTSLNSEDNLTQITDFPENSSYRETHTSLAWSPDDRWIAGINAKSGIVTAPVNENIENSGVYATGATGCSPIFVVASDIAKQIITWPNLRKDQLLFYKNNGRLDYIKTCVDLNSNLTWSAN